MDKINDISPVKTGESTDMNDGICFYGGAVKAAGIVGGFGTLEGYSVVFDPSGAPTARDLAGQYFSAKTYLGPQDGDGSVGTFHHTLTIDPAFGDFSDHLFAPVKSQRDDIGIFTQIVLDMSDKYEAAVYKMGEKNKLGFSSGTAAHMIRCAPDGEILRWPIVETALTPTPCEPRARATAMKALEAESGSEAMATFAGELKAIFESQEIAEQAFVNALDIIDEQGYENMRLAEIAAIRLDAIRMQADVLRLALMR